MKKNKKSFKFFYHLFILFLSVLFLGIGYAQIANINLSISGSAVAVGQTGIVISDIHYDSCNNISTDTVDINTYYQNMFSSDIELGNDPSSYITLSVTIDNLTNQKYIFDSYVYDDTNTAFYSNLNIVPSLSGITENSTILNANGTTGDSITFNITFSYLNTSNITNTTLSAMVSFHFTPMVEINYSGLTNSAGNSSEYIRSKSYTTMNNTIFSSSVILGTYSGGISITNSAGTVTLVENTDYTYSSGVVTFLIDIESDLTITATVNSGQPSTQTTTNNDGSTTTVTTEIVNGQPIVTEYSIDTSNVQGGSTVPSGGIDTGVLVFDGYDFEATLKASFTLSEITTGYAVINMSANNGSDMHGIIVLINRATSGMGTAYNENNATIGNVVSGSPCLKFRYNKYENNKIDSSASQDFYSGQGNTAYHTNKFGTKTSPVTLIFKIRKQNGVFSVEIQDQNGNTVAKPRNASTFSFSSITNDVTFEIGHYTNTSGVDSTCPMKVLSFDIVKTVN